MITGKSKAIVISNATNFILLIIGVIVLIAALIFLFPASSTGIGSLSLQIKKPFCCNVMGCKPAGQQVTQNPLGGFACTAFCLGACG